MVMLWILVLQGLEDLEHLRAEVRADEEGADKSDHDSNVSETSRGEK